MLPPGADAAVMVEHTQLFGADEIEVLRPVAPGENVLQVGEDVQPGEQILPAGHRLLPQDIGALLALGLVDQLRVVRPPRVCLFSTGDELVSPESKHIEPGQVRDINSATIWALCQRAGADCAYDGHHSRPARCASGGINKRAPRVGYAGRDSRQQCQRA